MNRTDRELDIAIVGRGSFCLCNALTAECRYSRSGRLHIDANGELAVTHDGVEWLVDPPITIPNDWERISVLSDGTVQTLVGQQWLSVGQFQLAVFASTPTFDDPLVPSLESPSTGPTLVKEPGSESGVIQQGWLEQRPPVLEARATRVLLAILTAGVLSRCLMGNVTPRRDEPSYFASRLGE